MKKYIILIILMIGYFSFYLFIPNRYNNKSSSMEPTILKNDEVIWSEVKDTKDLRIGDLVIMKSSRSEGAFWVRRIAAIGPCQVEVLSEGIVVNAIFLSWRDFFGYENFRNQTKITSKQVILKEGDFFLLGDNLDVAIDSRTEGAYDFSRIAGKVEEIYRIIQSGN